MSVAGILHQHSPFTIRNHRLTPEGARSLAALRSTLHVPPGAPDTSQAGINRPPVRIFILGARSESALPPHVWDQMCMLFPAAVFQVYFIGREISFPKEQPKTSSLTEEEKPIFDSTASQTEGAISTVWSPPIPSGFSSENKKILPQDWKFGIQSYYLPYSSRLSITAMKASFSDIYGQFQGSLDPYTDVFFLFHPGLGFPSLSQAETLQINSEAEWGSVIPQLIESKCAIFFSGFSPADVERDVRSLDTATGVAGEFDWILTPGQNPFGSDKWDIAEFDPRVMVKTNWGLWGIRGKRRDVRERTFAS